MHSVECDSVFVYAIYSYIMNTDFCCPNWRWRGRVGCQLQPYSIGYIEGNVASEFIES